jgi:hypothetical protein
MIQDNLRILSGLKIQSDLRIRNCHRILSGTEKKVCSFQNFTQKGYLQTSRLSRQPVQVSSDIHTSIRYHHICRLSSYIKVIFIHTVSISPDKQVVFRHTGYLLQIFKVSSDKQGIVRQTAYLQIYVVSSSDIQGVLR